MKFKLYLKVVFRIILLCAIGMAWTYITPELRTFFGDVPQDCSNYETDSCWKWGPRHYWYHIGSIVIFIISILYNVFSITDNDV